MSAKRPPLIDRRSRPSRSPRGRGGGADEWEDAGEAVADELWGCPSTDTPPRSPSTKDEIETFSSTEGASFASFSSASTMEGMSLATQSRPRSLIRVLDEFSVLSDNKAETRAESVGGMSRKSTFSTASISTGDGQVLSQPPSSFVIRKKSRGRTKWEDEAKDLDLIGLNMKLTLDEESEMLQTPLGRREWIRKEMVRREGQFTKRKDLTIKCGSWNVGGIAPKVSLREWLLPNECSADDGADLYLIGFQEVQPLAGMSAVTTDSSRGTAWKEEVEKTLDCPQGYVTIAARQMVGILLVVAVKRIHEPFIRNVMLSDVGTGFMRSGGNKGSVSCSFALYDKNIVFVNAHFAAHEHNVERRNEDFLHCMRKTSFSPDPGSPVEPSPFSYLESNDKRHDKKNGAVKPFAAVNNKKASASGASKVSAGNQQTIEDEKSTTDPSCEPDSKCNGELELANDDMPAQKLEASADIRILNHDAVFWVGDLNYRVELSPADALELIEKKNYRGMVKYDQLQNARDKGEVFQGFKEGELKFAPTYKQSRNSSEYEKKTVDGEVTVVRTPSWTDRVLWRDGMPPSSKLGGDVTQSLFNKRSLPARLGRKTGDLDKLASQGGVNLLHYGRVDLLSSDHRPVVCDFTLDFRIIDIKKRNDVVRQLQVDLGRREAALQPLLSVSAMELELGSVKYGEIITNKAASLSLSNAGRVRAFVAIQYAEFPPWLSLENDSSDLVLAPGSSVDLVFNVLVTAHMGVAPALNMRQVALGTVIRFILQHEDELGVSIFGQYIPTCLGNTLPLLASSVLPIIHKKNGVSAMSSAQRVGLPIPKEIWQLANFLYEVVGKFRESEKLTAELRRLFFSQGLPSDVAKALSCIDSGEPFPKSLQPTAVGTCLLDLLNSLEEPTIPARCVPACIEVGDKEVGTVSQEELVAALKGAPAVNINTIVYICSFLSTLPGAAKANREYNKGTDKFSYSTQNSFDGFPSPKALAKVFSSVFFGMEDERSEGECEGKVDFILHLIYSGDRGQLHAIFKA